MFRFHCLSLLLVCLFSHSVLSLSLCTPRRSSTSGTCDSKEPNARLKIAPQLLQRVVLTLVVYDPGPTDDPTDWFDRVSQTQLRRTAITRSRHALTAVDKLTDHVCLCNQCCHDHTETRSSHRQLRHVQGAPPPPPRGTHHLVDAAYLKSSVRQSIWLHHVFQAQQSSLQTRSTAQCLSETAYSGSLIARQDNFPLNLHGCAIFASVGSSRLSCRRLLRTFITSS